MIKLCDICGKPGEPGQGMYGGPRTPDHVRHYDCHLQKYGRAEINMPLDKLRIIQNAKILRKLTED